MRDRGARPKASRYWLLADPDLFRSRVGCNVVDDLDPVFPVP